MFLILLILDDPHQTNAVLKAWDEAGAPGVTVLLSTGIGRIRRRIGLGEELPLIPSLEDFLQLEEKPHRTFFTIVRGQELVDRIVQATHDIIGDLNRPHTGILVVLPVLEAYGLDRYKE
jgi:hypothetical protein